MASSSNPLDAFHHTTQLVQNQIDKKFPYGITDANVREVFEFCKQHWIASIHAGFAWKEQSAVHQEKITSLQELNRDLSQKIKKISDRNEELTKYLTEANDLFIRDAKALDGALQEKKQHAETFTKMEKERVKERAEIETLRKEIIAKKTELAIAKTTHIAHIKEIERLQKRITQAKQIIQRLRQARDEATAILS